MAKLCSVCKNIHEYSQMSSTSFSVDGIFLMKNVQGSGKYIWQMHINSSSSNGAYSRMLLDVWVFRNWNPQHITLSLDHGLLPVC